MIRESESAELTVQLESGERLAFQIEGPANRGGVRISAEVWDEGQRQATILLELEDLQHILRWAEAVAA